MRVTSQIVFALLGLPLAVNAAPSTLPPREVAPVAELTDLVDGNPDFNSTASELEKRQHCTLIIRWTGNWDEIGRRYRVVAQAIPDGGVYWNSWAMAESWVTKCRSGADTWANNPQAWQDSDDPAKATCDVSFPHGSDGHNKYKWWHEQAAQSWARSHPGCIVDMQV
ncbi:hypothetical protein B0I35DRAFT_482462 [Stachybotrys elegans]|uniref:Secreted protein n=1 Tax=Stachybotrys elegans TaxID=80388 RepID=A0A8K0SNR5_9HYPO|nr:hypothetical protein B0I35DRAFT_482462 [Stachybotrys elegans]